MGRRVAPPENPMSLAAGSGGPWSAGTVARRLAHGTLPRQLPGSAARPARGIRRGGPARATTRAGRGRAGARPARRLRDAARGGDVPDGVLLELHRAPELGRDRAARRRRPRVVPPRHPPTAGRARRMAVARRRGARRVPRRARARVPHGPGHVDRLRADRRPRAAVRVGDLAHDHGRELPFPRPSSYLVVMSKTAVTGYPGAGNAVLGSVGQLLGVSASWTYQPFMAFSGGMLSLGIYGLLARVVPSRGLRALAAFVAAQPSTLYGYALVGGIKELRRRRRRSSSAPRSSRRCARGRTVSAGSCRSRSASPPSWARSRSRSGPGWRCC